MINKNDRITNFINHILLIILCALVVIPFVILVSASFSDEKELALQGYSVVPRGVTLEAYKYVFKNPKTIINAYTVTIFTSLVYTFLATFLMSLLAYPLTKKDMPGRNGINFYVYFTMLFSGGLVPTYILITEYLNLDDTIWVYVLPGLISPWYVFMMRTFFQDIPYEISESACIDGAGEYTIFFRMILPLSKPVLATVALFTFLGKWSDWNTAMLYINDDNLISLQYLLQRIMENITLLTTISDTGGLSMTLNDVEIPSETVRMAMAVIVAGPALLIFPFFQKYFVKGLTVGSVKG